MYRLCDNIVSSNRKEGVFIINFKKQYISIFRYFRQNSALFFLTLLCLAEVLIFCILNTEADNRYGEYVAEVSVNYSGLFPFIFFENLKTSLMIVLIGTVPLWFGSLFAAYLTFHGLVSTAKLLLPDVGGSNMLLSLLPHATFELPALIVSFLISAFWSRAVSVSIVNIFRKRPVISVLREGITSSVKTVLFVLLPLVLIAAAVEVLITPAVMKALL